MQGRDTGILVPILGVSLLATGCVSPVSRSVDAGRLAESGGYRLIAGIKLPAVRGVEGCGAQGLAAVLAFEDPSLDAVRLAEALPWHDEGATPVDLLLAARQRGFTARIARGTWECLDESVQRGRPVLVMFDAAPAMWASGSGVQLHRTMHWSIVSGFADDGSALLLAGERGRVHLVRRADFLRRWAPADCCMIVVGEPAGEAPSSGPAGR